MYSKIVVNFGACRKQWRNNSATLQKYKCKEIVATLKKVNILVWKHLVYNKNVQVVKLVLE